MADQVKRPQGMLRSTLGQASRWPVVGLLALTALVLGYIGWFEYWAARPETKSIWDLLYLDVQLFFLQSGAVPGPMPVALEIARFLAFSVAAFAAIKGVALLARDRVAALRRRFLRGHTVIVGLGEKGRLLAETLRAEGTDVVVIETDPGEDSIPEVRALGVDVIVGNGTEPSTLAAAGVERAAHLLAMTGSDATNAEVATRAQPLVADRSGAALVCIAHVVDPELSAVLRREQLSCGWAQTFRLDFFNVPEAGARLVLELAPPDHRRAEPQVLVIGDGPLATQVAAHAKRVLEGRGHVYAADATDRIDPSEMDAIYVCPTDESSAVSTALELRHALRDREVPIVAGLRRLGGLAELLERSGTHAHRGELHAVAVIEETCRPEIVLGGTFEVLARAIHEEYVRSRARDGVGPGEEPSTRPWNDLPETLRESNRDQAAHIGVKLEAIGCALVPAERDPDTASFALEESEIEQLAVLEHDRWVAERRRNGWTLAPGERDAERKTTPHLVSWDELTDEIREYDRAAVRAIPQFLARAGYRIERPDRADTTRISAIGA